MTHPNVVIFSIDGGDDVHALSSFWEFFLNYVKPNSPVATMHDLRGCYRGQEEAAFMVSRKTWDDYIKGSSFVFNQESILTVTGCNKAYAALEFLDTGYTYPLGSLCEVSEEVARRFPDWTHRPDTGAWFVTAKVNPDHAGAITGPM